MKISRFILAGLSIASRLESSNDIEKENNELKDQVYNLIQKNNDLTDKYLGSQCWNMDTIDCDFGTHGKWTFDYRTQTCYSRHRKSPQLPSEYSVETMWPYSKNRNCVFSIICPPMLPVIRYRFERFDFDHDDTFTINGQNVEIEIGKYYSMKPTGRRGTMKLQYVTNELNETEGLIIYWSCQTRDEDTVY